MHTTLGRNDVSLSTLCLAMLLGVKPNFALLNIINSCYPTPTIVGCLMLGPSSIILKRVAGVAVFKQSLSNDLLMFEHFSTNYIFLQP